MEVVWTTKGYDLVPEKGKLGYPDYQPGQYKHNPDKDEIHQGIVVGYVHHPAERMPNDQYQHGTTFAIIIDNAHLVEVSLDQLTVVNFKSYV